KPSGSSCHLPITVALVFRRLIFRRGARSTSLRLPRRLPAFGFLPGPRLLGTQLLNPRFHLRLVASVARLVEVPALERVGQVLLRDPVLAESVGVLVAFAVAQPF